MQRVWNIGNTTVRNPKRIENALRVFFEEGFSGNAKGAENEKRLHAKLKEREVLEFDGKASDWNGRKWRAAFYQLGFVSYEKYTIEGEKLTVKELFQRIDNNAIQYPYELTIAGRKLIEAKIVPEIEEIYTRQFSCYELPNSLETSFPEGNMKPFILFLQVLKLLQDAGLAGLNKFETGMFVQRFRDHTANLAKEIFIEIVGFREALGKSANRKEIKKTREKYLTELQKFSGIKPASVVNDYSDTTFRYFSLSGLFTRVGETLIIRDNKRDFVNKLLEKEPEFLFKKNPFIYFENFYNNSFLIPTDKKVVALDEINILKEGIRDKENNQLFRKVEILTIDSEIIEIQQIRYELIEYHNWEREVDYANEQQTEFAIKDIISYLRVLNSEKFFGNPIVDDRPAFLEWAVWRCFLAIDEIVCPIHETRRFPIDQDFMPRNTAPGHGSDLIFEFESYVLVVEVTLTTSHRQMAVESEPVKRHTAFYKKLFPNKAVYCLFIAPDIDNNVAETFRVGIWYNLDEEENVNIIPLPLKEFIYVFQTIENSRFRNKDILSLLDCCLVNRNLMAPQWKKRISKEVIDWRARIMA